MKKIYVLADGQKILATPAKLVAHMKAGSYDDKDETTDQFMFRTSERVLLSMQEIVRIDTPQNFIDDLKACGIITHIMELN